jgi:hypothetical protein
MSCFRILSNTYDIKIGDSVDQLIFYQMSQSEAQVHTTLPLIVWNQDGFGSTETNQIHTLQHTTVTSTTTNGDNSISTPHHSDSSIMTFNMAKYIT